ncbi:Histone deacetylase domain-containing protein [Cladophialophora immunda]|nr:Histone deacetylase domain-containing protein [Cladophialophora immunda]
MTVVQEYQDSSSSYPTPTLTLSAKIQREIEANGITRPKGYDVSWHYNPAVENHHFGQTHPMKPWRLTLTKSLVLSYGMHTAMDCYTSRPATREEIAAFHKDAYVDFLMEATPQNIYQMYPELEKGSGYSSAIFGVGDDCPIFDGLYAFCSTYAGASIDAARKLCNKQSDIAINWSGGLHHAKKAEASGFCYVNDIVLAVLQLLRYHPRVLYIDIDVHHGDGVEQAFWSTDRVMCVSFHKYDKEVFFPGTGPLESTGPIHPDNPGKNYTINVPLNDGIDDETYDYLFRSVVEPTIKTYRPSAIVLQCGADSLGHDRLGCFNLGIRGHGNCVSFVKSFQIPLLVVGGGGYTPRNVARAWTNETSICIGADSMLNPQLPEFMPHREAFRKEGFTLFPNLGGWRNANLNSKQDIEKIIRHVREQLVQIRGAPSVQMKHIPEDIQGWRDEVEEDLKAKRLEREEKAEERDGAGGLLAKASRRRELERAGGSSALASGAASVRLGEGPS